VEVYGAAKQGVAYNYLGQRCGRPHLATWAGTGLTLAAALLTGTQDVRAHSSALLGRAVAALPTEVRDSFGDDLRPVVRADAGYFAAELAHTAAGLGCDFAVAGWPPHTYTIIRRVRVDTEALSTDPRSRRRRTIDRDQLTPALDGQLDCVWATSFIVTNLPTGGDGFDNATDVEAWFGDCPSMSSSIRTPSWRRSARHSMSRHRTKPSTPRSSWRACMPRWKRPTNLGMTRRSALTRSP